MNKVTLIGRPTSKPEIRYSKGDKTMCIAKFCLAVARKFKRDGEPDADFIYCTVFGKLAESVEKYLTKGTKIALAGRIQTRSYTNREGVKVYTSEIIVEEWEFAESNKSQQETKSDHSTENTKQNTSSTTPQNQEYPAGFMSIPDGIEEELPFI